MSRLGEIVFVVTFSALLATGTLVLLALVRRKQREKRVREMAKLRLLSFPILNSLATGTLDYQPALQALGETLPSGSQRAQVVERLLFDGKLPTSISVPLLRRLAMDFGLVELWERSLLSSGDPVPWREAAFHPKRVAEWVRALHRARSAGRLGLIRHAPSWPLLVQALEDPYPEVRSAAAFALGGIAEPLSFPALVDRLLRIVLAPSAGLSLRHIKAALVCFPLRQATELVESLKHSHPRVRFLAAEVVREMVECAAAAEAGLVLSQDRFAPELTELFLARLVFDENPDVRARAAPVIARLGDPRAPLRLVTLLDDVQWFVRLHAVRALAQPRLITLVEHLSRRLTDVNWRVREAAVGALLSLGPKGAERLLEHFLTTQDRYSLEQIAEGLQRAGLLPVRRGENGHHGGWEKAQVTEQLLGLGKTSYLDARLDSGANDH
jgi:HEAT repeat protein